MIGFVSMKINDVFVGLTERESVVLAELSKGCANKEIANNLVISVPTVRTHLRSIYVKMKVRSRTEAIIKYLQLNQKESGDTSDWFGSLLGVRSHRPN